MGYQIYHQLSCYSCKEARFLSDYSRIVQNRSSLVCFHSTSTFLTRLLIRYEHRRLNHAGPAPLSSSLNRLVHIIGERRTVRSITRAWSICRRATICVRVCLNVREGSPFGGGFRLDLRSFHCVPT